MMASAAFDLASYLARCGLAASFAEQAPTLETLTQLQSAHLRSIAFENLDVVHRKPINMSSEAVFAKLVTARRGGYCFEHNTLIQVAKI